MTSEISELIDASLSQRFRFNTISNNLANINTIAFKRDIISFNEILSMENYSVTDFSPGKLQYTGNKLDVALASAGFFSVQTSTGIKYTRDGSFSVNKEKFLTTRNGDPVLGQNGPIKIDGEDVSIGSDGCVKIKNEIVETLAIVDFSQPSLLKKEGMSYYSYQGNPQDILIPENVHIQQGYTEGSNVNPTEEMIKMIETLRMFETTQKAIQSIDEATNKIVNDVGILQ